MSTKSHRATKSAPAPAVVLFGVNGSGKPRAAYFGAKQVDLALKAANQLGLTVLRVVGPEQSEVAAQLPAGQIYASGRGVVPFVRKGLYAKLTQVAKLEPPARRAMPQSAASPARKVSSASERADGKAAQEGSNQDPSAGSDALLPNWEAIAVGHRVVAQESDPEDGWSEATVVRIDGDMLTLRWCLPPNKRFFARHRLNVGLMCPKPVPAGNGPGATASISHQAKATTSENGPKPGQEAASAHRYPESWNQIDLDRVVLAKEDGPSRCWWEAVPVEKQGDLFTVRWLNFTEVPNVVRHRLSFALLNPNPGIAAGR
jgi:hypothetical protein